MRNVFLVYMPPNNAEAMQHYHDTIQRRVPMERLSRFLPTEIAARLRRIFDGKSIAVWGSRDGPANRSKFERMSEGDDLLIVEGSVIKFLGKIALKVVSADLSRELWQNIGEQRDDGWDLIYFIANPVEVGVPFEKFCSLFGYRESYRLQGLTAVSREKLAEFHDRYDDLYSILMRMRAGQPIEVRDVSTRGEGDQAPTEMQVEDFDEVQKSPLVSDHVKMQWKLASLGVRAGEKVWIPAADQMKLQRIYEFNAFEREFASGIDLQKNYFENIDVVWKHEYRIDAAFEIENSTAIYSGLLRFADLNVVAPNTLYPMFVVAPNERKARVREQLLRPSFTRLELRDKVLFLSYERVDEIEEFFAATRAGPTVEVMKAKAELLTKV